MTSMISFTSPLTSWRCTTKVARNLHKSARSNQRSDGPRIESYEEEDLPHHFSTVGAVYPHGNRYVYSGKIEIDPNAPILHGLGCYPGKVKAPIQLIFKPEEAKDLDGKILCTVRTDPGWAPLFPSVSGILVEHNSTLSPPPSLQESSVSPPSSTSRASPSYFALEEVTMDGDLGTVERDPENVPAASE